MRACTKCNSLRQNAVIMNSIWNGYFGVPVCWARDHVIPKVFQNLKCRKYGQALCVQAVVAI